MKGISKDAPWRGQGDVIRNRTTGYGKGDKGRPMDIPSETFQSNWERTFGTRKKQADEATVQK